MNVLDTPIHQVLFRLSWPTALSMGFVLGFQVIDSIYIGMLGVNALAAIGFIVPITFLILSTVFGLGSGVAAVGARYVGQKTYDRLGGMMMDSLILGVCLMAVISGIGYYYMTPLFSLIGAAYSELQLISDYMGIWFAGSLFIMTGIVSNNGMRALGDAQTPGIILAISGMINAILDPFLIFGWGPFPELGFKGAAIATVISWISLCLMSLFVLGFRYRIISLSRPTRARILHSWKEVTVIAVPATLSELLSPITMSVLTSFVAIFGIPYVAAFGIGLRLEPFLLIFVIGLGLGLLPFVGQHLGAGKIDRLRNGVFQAIHFIVIFECLLWAIVAIFGSSIAAMFSNDTEVIRLSAQFFRWIPACYPAFGLIFIVSMAFNALNRSWIGLLLWICNSLLIISSSFIMKTLFGMIGIYMACIASSWTVGILSYITIYYYLYRYPGFTKSKDNHYVQSL